MATCAAGVASAARARAAAAPCGPRCGSRVVLSTKPGVAAILGRPACWCGGGRRPASMIRVVVAPGRACTTVGADGAWARRVRRRSARCSTWPGLGRAAAARGARRPRRGRRCCGASVALVFGGKRLVGLPLAWRSCGRSCLRLQEVQPRLVRCWGVRRAHSVMRPARGLLVGRHASGSARRCSSHLRLRGASMRRPSRARSGARACCWAAALSAAQAGRGSAAGAPDRRRRRLRRSRRPDTPAASAEHEPRRPAARRRRIGAAACVRQRHVSRTRSTSGTRRSRGRV